MTTISAWSAAEAAATRVRAHVLQAVAADTTPAPPSRRAGMRYARTAFATAASVALLRRLEETRDVADVRAAADAMVTGIVQELRERAEQVRAG